MTTSNQKKLAGLLCGFAILAALISDFRLPGQEPVGTPKGDTAKKKDTASTAGAIEVRFTDDSTMKLQLREERLELETPYGKLLIPVADIQRIEFGQRISDELRKKIAAAIGDLGSADFRRRQTATTELVALREKAYPALASAAKGKDQETVRRIEEILEKIREAVPADVLEIPLYDVVHTADSKIAGRIKAEVLRVVTLPFGEQQVKITDIRSLRSRNFQEPEAAVASNLLDPANFHMYHNQFGKTFTFRITGPQPGQPGLGMQMRMGVFGTDVYTTDSSLEWAAVHAGAVQPGKTAAVRVTMVGQHPGFQPSVRNGIASQPWGAWTGFRIEPPRGGPVRNKD